MTILQATVLGLVQGLSEFLPISSSAHLLLFRWVAHWPDPGLAFDVALHWGTLAGVLIYFRTDIKNLILGAVGSLAGKREFENRFPWMIALGTIPAGVIGLLLEDRVESTLRSPIVIVVTLAAMGLLLYVADRAKQERQSLDMLTWTQAFFIGAAQGIAVIPGVSRSGISITIALLFALRRDAAVQFSFLLSIPLILGAGITKIGDIATGLQDASLWFGMITSAMSGYAAIYFLMNYVKNKSFTPFVVYRCVLAVVLLFFLL